VRVRFLVVQLARLGLPQLHLQPIDIAAQRHQHEENHGHSDSHVHCYPLLLLRLFHVEVVLVGTLFLHDGFELGIQDALRRVGAAFHLGVIRGAFTALSLVRVRVVVAPWASIAQVERSLAQIRASRAETLGERVGVSIKQGQWSGSGVVVHTSPSSPPGSLGPSKPPVARSNPDPNESGPQAQVTALWVAFQAQEAPRNEVLIESICSMPG
jgi:hypothetical protein